jgi:TDG/mug DNA glycosylase family protein
MDLHRRTSPMQMHRLYRHTTPGDRAQISVRIRRDEEHQRALDLVAGGGFVVERIDREPDDNPTDGLALMLHLRRIRSIADTVGPNLRLLVCGLNPSVYSADAGAGFARPGNRYWPAALAAGIVQVGFDPIAAFRNDRVGMTDLVKRATPRADELTADEYRSGLERLARLAAWLTPAAVCFVGLAGWRAAVDRRAVAGWQSEGIGGAPAYVMPSTSGLNARVPVTELADHLRAAAAGPPV